MQRYIKIVGNGRKTARSMTSEEASEAMQLIMEGQATPAQIGAFLGALRLKEETGVELAAFATTLRRYCQTVRVERENLVDLCLPYDGRSKALSLVPAAAITAAAAGASIALHGRLGYATPPKFGLSVGDTLAELGVAVHRSLASAARLLEQPEIGLAWVSTENFAPALERLNTFRVEYGLRSFLNSIEKLLNPFSAPTGIAGVFHSPVLYRVSEALVAQGYRRGLAVHGPEGSLDVLPSRLTKIVEFRPENSEVLTWAIDPAEYGWRAKAEIETDEAAEIQQPLSASQNAALTLALLQPGDNLLHERRGMLLTTGLFLYAAGLAGNIGEGLRQAQEVVDNGAALERLERWRRASQNLGTSAQFVILPGGKIANNDKPEERTEISPGKEAI